jgi:FdhD protein
MAEADGLRPRRPGSNSGKNIQRNPMLESVRRVEVLRADLTDARRASDALAVEDPLEIRLDCAREGEMVRTTLAVTMRTPGHDVELAAGYLYTEGIIGDRRDIARIGCCGPGRGTGPDNRIRVELAPHVAVEPSRHQRQSYTASSCGACGKTSMEALRARRPWPLRRGELVVPGELLRELPSALRRAQSAFDSTGGLHAAALFDPEGRPVLVREDVGRHNALDKVIGALLLVGALPAHERILIVSGRVSFELVEKALMAGIPVLAAIGAPSSLAVETAREAGMTLVGFLTASRFNVYCGADRILVHDHIASETVLR